MHFSLSLHFLRQCLHFPPLWLYPQQSSFCSYASIYTDQFTFLPLYQKLSYLFFSRLLFISSPLQYFPWDFIFVIPTDNPVYVYVLCTGITSVFFLYIFGIRGGTVCVYVSRIHVHILSLCLCSNLSPELK